MLTRVPLVPGPGLERYRAKRRFSHTPEPEGASPPVPGTHEAPEHEDRGHEDPGHEAGRPGPAEQGGRFVVQQHAARRMHYDFRLEVGGVLVSWAVPKGPSYNPRVKRLAVKVEDHPLEYRNFEGGIPRGNYGAGSVIVWDEGLFSYIPSHKANARSLSLAGAIEAGHLSVRLEGHKLVGGWSLTRFDGDNWTLVKRSDEHASATVDITAEAPGSVRTGRTVFEVGASGDPGPGGSAETQLGRGDSPAERPGTSLAEAQFCEPMLAQANLPPGPHGGGALAGPEDEWLFEPKLDGLRCLAVRNDRNVMLWSRNRLPFNARFPAVVSALAALPASNFVLDGELVALVEGRPDFSVLQQGNGAQAEYHVFDLPWLLGQDLRHLPIEDRKALLAQTVIEGPCLKLVGTLAGSAGPLLAQACADGWEGLIAKRSGSAYRAGRGSDWYKLKCGCRQELVIAGFTPPRGSRHGFGALLLGYWAQGELKYAGKVGTGFTQKELASLFGRLARTERPTSPFSDKPPERGARWVEPALVAEVAFTGWTPDGRLRHPSYLGLREDKAAADVVREPCGPSPRPGRAPSR